MFAECSSLFDATVLEKNLMYLMRRLGAHCNINIDAN